MTDLAAQQQYNKMHPEPITVWTDELKIPTSLSALSCHYILFTDDQVGSQRMMICVTARLRQIVTCPVLLPQYKTYFACELGLQSVVSAESWTVCEEHNTRTISTA